MDRNRPDVTRADVPGDLVGAGAAVGVCRGTGTRARGSIAACCGPRDPDRSKDPGDPPGGERTSVAEELGESFVAAAPGPARACRGESSRAAVRDWTAWPGDPKRGVGMTPCWLAAVTFPCGDAIR